MAETDASDARTAAYAMCRDAAELYRAAKVDEAAAIHERVVAQIRQTVTYAS